MLALVCDPFSLFKLKISNILTSSGWEWKRVSCLGNKILIAADVFPVELLAFQVSMVCASNWPS